MLVCVRYHPRVQLHHFLRSQDSHPVPVTISCALSQNLRVLFLCDSTVCPLSLEWQSSFYDSEPRGFLAKPLSLSFDIVNSLSLSLLEIVHSRVLRDLIRSFMRNPGPCSSPFLVLGSGAQILNI